MANRKAIGGEGMTKYCGKHGNYFEIECVRCMGEGGERMKKMYVVSGMWIGELNVVKETAEKVKLDSGRYMNKVQQGAKIYERQNDAIDAAYANGLRMKQDNELRHEQIVEELEKLIVKYNLKGVRG